MRFGKSTLTMLIALITLLSVVLVGCKADEDTAKTTAVKSEEQLPLIGQTLKFDPNLDIKGKIEIWSPDETSAYFDPIVEAYREHRPYIKINHVKMPWGDYWKKIPIAISSGNGPDLFYMHNMSHDLMVDGKLMMPYPDDLVKDLNADFTDVMSSQAADGNIYYTSIGVGHAIIYYNKTLWAEAGLTEADIPETWEQFREIAIKLTKMDGDQMTVSGFNIGANGAFIQDMQLAAGRFLFSEDGKKSTMDNPDFKKSFEFFTNLILEDKVVTTTYPDGSQSFMDGTSAMIWNHPFFGGMMLNSGAEVDFGIFPLPKFEGNARNWHYNNPDVTMGISSKASKEAQAIGVDFLRLAFADDQFIENWCYKQKLAPPKKSLLNSKKLMDDEMISIIMEDIENSIYLGTVTASIGTIWANDLWDAYMVGGVDYETAVATTVARTNELLETGSFYPTERLYKYASELK
jgi:multiple sugar transport system substrate-binding protein